MIDDVSFDDLPTWEHVLAPGPSVVRYEHVEAEAGEGPISLRAIEACERLKGSMGDAYYSDLLFVLTHRRYAPAHARALWQRILAHRDDLRRGLGRNPRIAVAALDYLANVEGGFARPALIDEIRLSRLVQSATRDSLTGLYDRSTLWPLLQREMSEGHAVSVLMLDVDHFKRINDLHGHLVGDVLLARLAGIVVASIRDSDVAVRYGGEEICVVLRGHGPEEARALAERLRVRIAEELAPEGVTVSVGVASFPEHGREPVELVRAADHALYHSKHAGRNRVSVSASGPCPTGEGTQVMSLQVILESA